jgi:inner membrane protein involved in colicin E2 resistance
MLYQSDLKLSGHFNSPNLAALQISPEQVQWEKATLHMGIF